MTDENRGPMTPVFPFANIIYHVTLLLDVSVNQKREKSRKKVFSRTRVGVLCILSLLKKSSEKRGKARFRRRFFRVSAKIYGRHDQNHAKGGHMKQPKSVPDNIWEAVRVVAEALQRKFETPLALSADASLSNATPNQSSRGGYNAKDKCGATPAGQSEPDGFA